MSRITKVQECDARDDAQGTAAGKTIFITGIIYNNRQELSHETLAGYAAFPCKLCGLTNPYSPTITKAPQ